MAEKNQGTQGIDAAAQAGGTPAEGDKQSMLLKLAERTVLQAETLAQEITDHARQESEAEGARIIAQHTEQAKAEAQRLVEAAQRRSEEIVNGAIAEARADTEKTLKKAQADGEKMLSKAQAESEKMTSEAKADSEKLLTKARSDSDESLTKAQSESREVLARARQDALAIVNAAQARAESTESKARLKAEFIIRETTQNVSDGVRGAVMETCNSLLASLEHFEEEFSKEIAEAPALAAAGATVPGNSISARNEETAAHDGDAPAMNESAPKAKSSNKRTVIA
ncbi:MAG: hypothetical protein O3A93_14170 [Chloroflexi bacterium]|nr:hypothetical protein [Chloroflexota bacterium]MDA1272373.1 hypothetical protein [Chloroflexota bacterium]